MDASNMLKPALARGELRCVGATTLDEYRKYVEKDAALERRFQPVPVGEPSVEDTIAILRGLKGRYEVHHGVRIKDSALIAAATLSHRYISDRFLPDKAIDLVDEAASRLKIEIDSVPDGDRRGGAPQDPARDRAAGAAEGDRPGVAGAALGDRVGAVGAFREDRRRCAGGGRRRSGRSPGTGRSRSGSSRPSRRCSGRRGRGTSRRRPS